MHTFAVFFLPAAPFIEAILQHFLPPSVHEAMNPNIEATFFFQYIFYLLTSFQLAKN